jgi:hypothetical protein
MFLSENQFSNYSRNESILESVIAILEEYNDAKFDIVVAESNFLVSRASGVLFEAGTGVSTTPGTGQAPEVPATKQGLKEKASALWEKVKAFFERVIAAVRRGIQGAMSSFGMDKKWIDKNLAAVKAVKSQAKFKAEIVDIGVMNKLISLLDPKNMTSEDFQKNVALDKKTEWVELTKGLISIEEVTAQKLAASSLASFNSAIEMAKLATKLEAGLVNSRIKLDKLKNDASAPNDAGRAKALDTATAFLSFLAFLANSCLSAAKRIKNASMSGMKRAVGAKGDAAEADDEPAAVKAESYFNEFMID